MMKFQQSRIGIPVLFAILFLTGSCRKTELATPGTATTERTTGRALSRPTTISRNLPAAVLVGQYVNATDTCQTTPTSVFDASVTLSSTVNNGIDIHNFGAWGLSVTVSASVSGYYTINIPVSQTLAGGYSLVAASGTIISLNTPVKFKTTYTWSDGTYSENCRSWYTHY